VDDTYHYLSSRGLQGNHKTRIPSDDFVPASTTKPENGHAHKRLWLFPLSASDPTSLGKGANVLARYLASAKHAGEKSDNLLAQLSLTLNNRRSRLAYRHGIVAGTEKELIDKLDAQITPSRLIKVPPKIAFILTGQGAQWWGMGRELISHPVFRTTLDLCDKAVHELGAPWKLIGKRLSILAIETISNVTWDL
jgi:acyl transferase domain-containing protein